MPYLAITEEVPARARRRLVVFDTHPIQYRSPVFQALAQREPGLRVYFFNAQFNSRRWWFHERGKHPKQVWGRKLDQGYPNAVLDTDRLSLFARWKRLDTVLERERPDAVALYGYYLTEHWMLRVACARRKIPLIFIGETFAPSRSRWRGKLKSPLLRAFFGGVAQYIAIGDRNRDYYTSRGVGAERITQARYCIDTDFFLLPAEEAKRERAAWRAEIGVAESDLVALFVGRLFERKRPGDLLAIAQRSENVHIAVVGNGPLEESLRREAQGFPRLHFLGFRDQAGTRRSYYGADVLVVPSEYETWGLVVNEAATCGIPALVTETCGVAGDLVRDSETGYVFRPGDIDAVSAILRNLARDRQLCRRLGEQARERVTREYRPEQFADAFVAALDRVVKR